MITSAKKSILIAEDEKSLSKAMKLRLHKNGYDVTIAENGKEANKYLDKKHYDLILLDIIMPIEDGFSVLGHVQQNLIDTPVIVMTNLTQEEDKQRCKRLGAKLFIVKANISLREFDQVVERNI